MGKNLVVVVIVAAAADIHSFTEDRLKILSYIFELMSQCRLILMLLLLFLLQYIHSFI